MVSGSPPWWASGFDAQFWQPEMTLGIIEHMQQKRAGWWSIHPDFETHWAKSSEVWNRGYQWPLKRVDYGGVRLWWCGVCKRVPVAPQNGPRSNKNLKKNIITEKGWIMEMLDYGDVGYVLKKHLLLSIPSLIVDHMPSTVNVPHIQDTWTEFSVGQYGLILRAGNFH